MIDIEMSLDGDFILDSSKTIYKEIADEDVRLQICVNRIKSVTNDWYGEDLNCNLEEVLGYPVIEATDKIIKTKIQTTLTFDHFIDISDLYIETLNADEHGINYVVYVKKVGFDVAHAISVDIDLVAGINIRLLR